MDVASLLADAPSPSVTLLPDGSVDRRFGVLDGDRSPVSRERFVASLSAGRRSFVTERRGVEAGGQAVNAALQADALGADVDLYGHLDHDVFDDLDLPAHSMGAPASVNVYEFDDAAMMLTAESAALREWSFDDLLAVASDAPLDADAVVWTNWASTPKGTSALRRTAERAAEGAADAGVFVVDPGSVAARTPAERRGFLDALAAVAEHYEVAVSVNDEELDALAAAIDAESEETRETAAAVRERAAAAAVVMHGTATAVAAVRDGTVRVPNYETATVERFTGGGDRFTAALAFGRACEWPWEQALALGNAAASHYVATGETGDRAALAADADESA